MLWILFWPRSRILRAFKGLKARGGSDLGEKIKSNCELGAKWELFMIGKVAFLTYRIMLWPKYKNLRLPKGWNHEGSMKDIRLWSRYSTLNRWRPTKAELWRLLILLWLKRNSTKVSRATKLSLTKAVKMFLERSKVWRAFGPSKVFACRLDT